MCLGFEHSNLLGCRSQVQFDAFQKGFLLLCDGPALSFLSPAELEELTCGETHLDFKQLRAGCR